MIEDIINIITIYTYYKIFRKDKLNIYLLKTNLNEKINIFIILLYLLLLKING